jgi:hypothetical protein
MSIRGSEWRLSFNAPDCLAGKCGDEKDAALPHHSFFSFAVLAFPNPGAHERVPRRHERVRRRRRRTTKQQRQAVPPLPS